MKDYKRVQFFVGLELDKYMQPVTATVADGLDTVLGVYPGGCTVVEGYGAWKAPGGETIREKQVTYTVLVEPHEYDVESVHVTAERLRRRFKQSAVLLTVDEVVRGGFY